MLPSVHNDKKTFEIGKFSKKQKQGMFWLMCHKILLWFWE